MSILAGFDLVLEVDRHTLLNVVLSAPAFAAYRPPFEQPIPISAANGGGEAHFVFNNTDLFLLSSAGRNLVVLRLAFEHSSIIGNQNVHNVLGMRHDLLGSHGYIDLTVPVSLDAGPMAMGSGPTTRVLTLHLESAGVACTFIHDTTPGSPSTSALSEIAAFAARGVQDQIRAQGAQATPLPFTVDPSATASLSPLVAANAQMAFFAPSGVVADAPQSLALCLSFAGSPPGDITARHAGAVPAGRNFVVAMSPRAFHTLAFVPAVQAGLGAMSPSQLPPTCGPADSIPVPSRPDWHVKRVEDTFRTGAIGVHIHAQGPTTDAVTPFADVQGHITLSIVPPGPSGTGSAIQPAWHADSLEGGAVAAGIAGFLTGIFGPSVSTALVETLAPDAASALALDPGGPIAIPLPLSGAEFMDVQVAPDELTISGIAHAPLMPSDQLAVQVRSVTDAHGPEIISPPATYHSVGCPEGDFSYVCIVQGQQVTFVAEHSFASEPVTYQWSVYGFNAPIAITGTGTAMLSATCEIPDPPPVTSMVRDDVAVPFVVSASGDRATFTIDPAYGNFQLNVTCRVTDEEGRMAETVAHVELVTHTMQFSDGYLAQLDACMRHFQQVWRNHLIQYYVPRFPPTGPGDPAQRLILSTRSADPILLAEAVLGATVQGKEGIAFVQHAWLGYGGSALNLALAHYGTFRADLQALSAYSRALSALPALHASAWQAPASTAAKLSGVSVFARVGAAPAANAAQVAQVNDAAQITQSAPKRRFGLFRGH